MFLLTVFFSYKDIMAQEISEDTVKSITAIRASGGVTVDGILSEDFWKRAYRSGDFVQYEPDEGSPASESTFVKVAFDDAITIIKPPMPLRFMCPERKRILTTTMTIIQMTIGMPFGNRLPR
jgi:hypothetical protein